MKAERVYFVVVNNTMFERCVDMVAQFTLQADKAFKTSNFDFALSIARQFEDFRIVAADALLGPRVQMGSDYNLYIL